jgi:cell division protease FtsH
MTALRKFLAQVRDRFLNSKPVRQVLNTKTARQVRSHPRPVMGVLLLFVLLVSFLGLAGKATEEANARKSPDVLEFEKKSEDWLNNQRNPQEFRKALEDHRLKVIGLANGYPGLLLYTTKDGAKASTSIPGCTLLSCNGTMLDKLDDRSLKDGFSLVRVDVDPRTPSRRLLDLIGGILSPLMLVGTMVGALMIVTRLQSGAGNAASKLSERPNLNFNDVIGNDEAKAALNRVKAFMQDPSSYLKVGARAPRGVLMVGPPGTGKTLLAKALAGESKASFIAVDGSYFTSMFYGAGVAKVKELFKLARKNAPCVLFIDEVDGIGKRTTGDMRGGESEMNRIINRVLTEMDGFTSQDNVVVVAATNHENNIDEAMRRPGRFDIPVHMTLPTLPERQKLFEMYIDRVVHDSSADTAVLARMTAGMSPADIANTVNKAASTAAEAHATAVNSEHLLRAIETHQLGGEVSAIKGLLTEDTRRRLAYHEAGHALVGHWLQAGVVERVTIEPRGQALGVTYITRDTEDPLYKQAELANRLAMMLGGREAELIACDSVSTGASDDLKRASELAIRMVGSLGFSKSFGLLSVAGVPKELLGPQTQDVVLQEARVLLENGQARCHQVLVQHRARLEALAEALLAKEVLSGEELKQMLGDRSATEVDISV